MKDAELEKARRDAAVAREELLASVHALQARLKPATLATDAWISAKVASESAASRAADAVSRRPVAAGAAAFGLAAFVARKPLARLFSKLRKR